MSQNDIISPVATVDTSQCAIITPWFVENTEYPPVQATYMPLVNGEEAFRAVHEAIANAKKRSTSSAGDSSPPCILFVMVKRPVLANCSSA